MANIYHISHVDNLESIMGCGGLFCDSLKTQRRLACIGIAHNHIKERRARRRVPTSHRGVLADYVPFYFAPRSPMLFSIHRGNVQQYQGGQGPILHLVSSAKAVQVAELPFTFTEGHAEMEYSEFFTELADLAKIDWEIMKAIIWRDTDQDMDRKRRRQAEFLVHQFFPWHLVTKIGVIDDGMRQKVLSLLSTHECRPEVIVRRDWYY